MSILVFIAVFAVILLGVPVAVSLAGVPIIIALVSGLFGGFDLTFLQAIPNRVYTLMTNELLIAVPMFCFMGSFLERSKLANDLIESSGAVFGQLRGGLAFSVLFVGTLLAASTGVVGATVTMLGLLSLPVMMKYKYDHAHSTGIIAASGTLGQIIPPSLVLIILGDVIGNANQNAQLELGNFAASSVSVGDLFAACIVPGLILAGFYLAYLVLTNLFKPQAFPALSKQQIQSVVQGKNIWLYFAASVLPPIILILLVLGSILFGFASPTEAAAVGSIGAIVLAILKKRCDWDAILKASKNAALTSAKIYFIFIGAICFTIVFKGFGGTQLIEDVVKLHFGSPLFFLIVVLLFIFMLGFFFDFIEISIVLLPIITPILIKLGFDALWLGVVFALVLQTSFLTPPLAFTLFYLRSVAPKEILTTSIYKGVMPYIFIQLIVIVIVFAYPSTVSYLPNLLFGDM